MDLRQIEVLIPEDRCDDLIEGLDDSDYEHLHALSCRGGERALVRLLVRSSKTESVTDKLSSRFMGTGGFRILVKGVHATLPEIPEPVDNQERTERGSDRISREELYESLRVSARLSTTYVVLVVLSSLVAAIGLIKDNVAIVIGAMVIAPLLGPNMALSLGSTLGDFPMIRRAVKTGMSGVGIAVVVALLCGAFFTVDPAVGQISSRTEVSLSDLVLAAAAGTAGVWAVTSGLPSGLIGVMVAVALMPPLVVTALLAVSGEWVLAGRAALLYSVNVACVNLAGGLTFLFRGIQPRRWWEASRARMASRIALALWALVLAALLALMFLAQRIGA